jgi:hypothetical protein
MSLFLEYEKLKASNQLLTPGSIWRDSCGDVKIREVNQFEVKFIAIPQGYNQVYQYHKPSFIKHFTRIS